MFLVCNRESKARPQLQSTMKYNIGLLQDCCGLHHFILSFTESTRAIAATHAAHT